MDNKPVTFRIKITGLVQGVGFRPYVYTTATRMALNGQVENRNDGVYISLNIPEEELPGFISQLQENAPPASQIESIISEKVPDQLFSNFSIVKSRNLNAAITEISPDIAVCEDCLADMDHQAHRLNYPFINCTHCGPRFSIIKELPYDRHHTTMHVFEMCSQCKSEYENVTDRRFHAQPVACNHCGPTYTLLGKDLMLSQLPDILSTLSELLFEGKVVAIKGLGGYHLMCDAHQEKAVVKLRNLKNREKKPFALMCKDLDAARLIAEISPEEEKILLSWQRPVVILQSRKTLSEKITGGLNTLGIMLPYLPLHHLLFRHLKTDCIVLTSGNLSDEPIIIDNEIASEKLLPLADALVVNNRDIHNRCDDSVVEVIGGKLAVMRRSRGFAPAPVKLNVNVEGIFAAGAELVNCFALGKENQAILSQHMGDLKNAETLDFYLESFYRFSQLFRFNSSFVVCDLHPDYLSSSFASGLSEKLQVPLLKVQHHHAHIAACMAENKLDEDVIGIALDGLGLGTDGQAWGGEFLLANLERFERKFHFEAIPIAGGDAASYEPWRSGLAYLYHYFGKDFLQYTNPWKDRANVENLNLYLRLIDQKINTWNYSSAGRLFDAVASILGLCQMAGYHAEAPVLLESVADPSVNSSYPYQINETIISFRPMFAQITEDLEHKIPIGVISARFHNTLVNCLMEVANQLYKQRDIRKVVLSGGSFQNKFMMERLIYSFQNSSLQLYYPSHIPANDGGIALGQMVIAAKNRLISR